MLAAVLSYFDARVGPRILAQISELPEYIKLDHLALLMDFYSEEFFIHEFGDLKTANRIFTVKNPVARGKVETCMISIVLLNDKLHELSSFKDIFTIFVREFKKIDKAYEGFYKELDHYPESIEKFEKIEKLLKVFYHSIPKEKIVFKIKVSRVLMYGLSKAGKSSVIKCLEQKVFNKSNLEKEVNLRKSLLGNLSITTYSFSEKNTFHDIMAIYTKNIDGLVFVCDASDTANYEKARVELLKINSFPETYKLPLLILLNKVDQKTSNIDELINELDLMQLKQKKFNYFEVSALKNEGITDAFNWLSTEITNTILKNPIVYFS